ncbi:MAG: hypothetical protein A2V93_04165 [Ignavibacteria bacterium RBG_16_34_14]|nr:MAG: hypothetical protein A2V93_04165 [Ignavibacteria bacterium RBG_16_34_14]
MVASYGETAPNGGTFGSMDGWPSVNSYRGTLNARTLGGQGINAHMVFSRCLTIPVELISFTANVNVTKVILEWSTATETNNYGFEIEKLKDSKLERLKEWEKIGYVAGFGTTAEPKSYSFTDQNLNSGIYKYRLKQIDFDGTFKYLPEVEVLTSTEFALNQNYPNPFNPSTSIKYQIPADGIVTLKIFDILGNEVKTLVKEHKPVGRYEVEFDASDLASGVYIYRMQVNGFTSTKKLMLLK